MEKEKMKTTLLMIIAGVLVLLPWIQGLNFTNNEVMVDGITTSAFIVMVITVTFSLISWFLFSWASKEIPLVGVLLGIITGASLVIPFLQVLGPMAGVILGVVAGFTAFMIQKKLTDPAKNQSLIIATIIFVATYLVLSLIILTLHTSLIWDQDNGIGAWEGTAERLENSSFDTIRFSGIGFVFFLVIIPSLIMTGLIIRGKEK